MSAAGAEQFEFTAGAPIVDLNGTEDGIDYAVTFVEDEGAVLVGIAALTVTDEDMECC